jgi:hypothetical protein
VLSHPFRDEAAERVGDHEPIPELFRPFSDQKSTYKAKIKFFYLDKMLELHNNLF